MNLDQAIAHVGSHTAPTPSMLANIIARIIVNFTAFFACWVPFRLFHQHAELAGAAMVLATCILNLYYALNAVIWHNDDIHGWPKGNIWCDVQLASFIPLETLNAAAICAVMANIAKSVSPTSNKMLSAALLTQGERRRKHLVQALIIFPVPLLQAVLYYFNIAMRYNISGIVGCQAVFPGNLVFLTVYLLPCPLFAVVAAYFAVVTWCRYRKVTQASQRALLFKSSNSSDRQARSTRTRRKLFLMALTIIIPYCPMQLVFLYNNFRGGLPWSSPYNLAQLHAPGWDRIDYTPSTDVPFVSMYTNYIAALEVFVFFIYFGRTQEAHDMYRHYLLALGFGKVFPKLVENEQQRFSKTVMSTNDRTRSPGPKRISNSNASTCSSFGPRDIYSSYGNEDFPSTTRKISDHRDVRILKNIRLSDLDLEAGRSVINKAQSDGNEPRLPYRSFWAIPTSLMCDFRVPELSTTVNLVNKVTKSATSHARDDNSSRDRVVSLRDFSLRSSAQDHAADAAGNEAGSVVKYALRAQDVQSNAQPLSVSG